MARERTQIDAERELDALIVGIAAAVVFRASAVIDGASGGCMQQVVGPELECPVPGFFDQCEVQLPGLLLPRCAFMARSVVGGIEQRRDTVGKLYLIVPLQTDDGSAELPLTEMELLTVEGDSVLRAPLLQRVMIVDRGRIEIGNVDVMEAGHVFTLVSVLHALYDIVAYPLPAYGAIETAGEGLELQVMRE